MFRKIKISILVALGLVFFTLAHADFTSPSFQLENPIDVISGGESSSPSFQYLSTTSQLSQGQSSSGSFSENAGFLYFPTATSPVIAATPGDTQVVLNWTLSTGTFANITSYDVGVGTVSGGPYTFTSVGNVLTDTKTGLTNGTPYFFKVRSFADGLLLSESAEVNATPVASVTPPPGGGGGGGGANTGVNFSGRAYPLSKVSILKDGQLALSTIAGPDSNFTANLSNLASGDYTFSVYGEDKNGLRSSPFTFQIFITSGVTTNIGGIFIAPTIAVDKTEVKKGDNITIFGQSAPTSQIVISVNSAQEFFSDTSSDVNGVYLKNFDTSVLDVGAHSTKSKAEKNGEISSYGDLALFTVGTKNVLANTTNKLTKCDLNGDGRCNLIDFSIAAYWYKRPLSAEMIVKEKKYLGGYGIIDLRDFSIMAFYWTG